MKLNEAVTDLLDFAINPSSRYGTGFAIDTQCGMVGKGELGLMWARSGSGKSTWVLNVAANTPEVPTAIVSMEMTPRRQAAWLTAMTQDLSFAARHIEDAIQLPDDDPRHIEVLKALTAVAPMYPDLSLEWMARPTVDELAMKIDALGEEGEKPERVFVDHMGLLSNCQDYQGYVDTAGQLHSWAVSENLAVIVLQQTGRGATEASSNVRDRNNGHVPVTLNSGVFAGETDADWVYGMYRPDRDPKFSAADLGPLEIAEYERVKGKVRLQVIKNRPLGDVCERGIELVYNYKNMRLADA